MIQDIIVVLLFAGAVFYLVRMFYRAAKPSPTGGCQGCSACSTIDFAAIEKQIEAKGVKGA